MVKVTDKKEKKEKLKKFNLFKYGSMVFGIGLLIAIIASFIQFEQSTTKVISATLMIIGIIIGILNITEKETTRFLIASLTIVLVLQQFLMTLVQTLGINSQVTLKIIASLFANITLLLVPAAIVVALKTIFITAKDEN